jgi:hypothetical protein
MFLPNFVNLDDESKKRLWLIVTVDDSFSLFLCSAIMTFEFCNWESKLRKLVPSFNTLKSEFEHLFKSAITVNSALTLSGLKLNYELCRFFLGGHRGIQYGEENSDRWRKTPLLLPSTAGTVQAARKTANTIISSVIRQAATSIKQDDTGMEIITGNDNTTPDTAGASGSGSGTNNGPGAAGNTPAIGSSYKNLRQLPENSSR